MPAPVYSVVIPVYNSEQSLIDLSERLTTVFNETLKETFEIIFVDDDSPNRDTWEVLKNLVAEYPNITAIQLQRNFGRTNAVLCGFAHSSGEYVIAMDDDLQHYPEDIPLLISKKDHDVVMAAFIEKKHNLQKRITSAIKNQFDAISLGKPRHIHSSSFQLIKRDIVEKLLKIKSAYPILAAMIYYTTRDVVNVPIQHHERKYTASGFNLRKRWNLFTNLIINNSSFSLRVLRYSGTLIFFVSVLMSLYYIFRRIVYQITVPGFTTLITVNLLFGGLILLSLGIIGEYIYRLIVNVEQKPAYIVRTVLPKAEDHE